MTTINEIENSYVENAAGEINFAFKNKVLTIYFPYNGADKGKEYAKIRQIKVEDKDHKIFNLIKKTTMPTYSQIISIIDGVQRLRQKEKQKEIFKYVANMSVDDIKNMISELNKKREDIYLASVDIDEYTPEVIFACKDRQLQLRADEVEKSIDYSAIYK